MGGVDKGLVTLSSRPMVAHVLDRFAPQVSEVLINANQNLDRYRSFVLYRKGREDLVSACFEQRQEEIPA